MKIIEEDQVRKLLTPEKCMEVMRKTFIDLELGKCTMPQRMICRMPNTAAFGFMPAYIGDFFGAKVITAYEPNMGTGYPSHIGYVMLFESRHCTVCGMIEAGSITEIRTGCVSAIATDLLAEKNAHTMAVIGAGAQARSHLAAIRLVREITEVMVYDKNPEASMHYAEEMKCKYSIPVKVCESVEQAVADADIICTVCPAKEAYLTRNMVKKGLHINAVGTFSPTTREVASDLIGASRLYSDDTSCCRKESGEYLIPLKEGIIKEDHIVGSIGELLLGKVPGRKKKDDITVFDALGLAVEDVASAEIVYLDSEKEKDNESLR